MSENETLADILAEPGWESDAAGSWYGKQAGPVYIEVYRAMSDDWYVLCNTTKRYGVSVDGLSRAVDEIRRIEAAIAREAGE